LYLIKRIVSKGAKIDKNRLNNLSSETV